MQAFMQIALEQAAAAAAAGEVPVGAVVVYDNQIIAQARNQKEASCDPLGHAEILAIRAAAQYLGRWRLTGCTLVVTLEPCPMCAGAIIHGRLDKLVFGAADPRTGAAGSLMNLLADARLNHRPEVVAGVMEAESSTLLKNFFLRRRETNRDNNGAAV